MSVEEIDNLSLKALFSVIILTVFERRNSVQIIYLVFIYCEHNGK